DWRILGIGPLIRNPRRPKRKPGFIEPLSDLLEAALRNVELPRYLKHPDDSQFTAALGAFSMCGGAFSLASEVVR
ncbi:unnamed protein product, partial [Symbiodinium sp. CCMP2456]